jgi:hypothetical protein
VSKAPCRFTGCNWVRRTNSNRKTGSLARADRTAKCNQLLYIEQELGGQAIIAGRAALEALRWAGRRERRRGSSGLFRIRNPKAISTPAFCRTDTALNFCQQHSFS